MIRPDAARGRLHSADQRGQGSLEYLGLAILVAAIITTLMTVTPVGDTIAAGLRSAVCRVTQQQGCASTPTKQDSRPDRVDGRPSARPDNRFPSTPRDSRTVPNERQSGPLPTEAAVNDRAGDTKRPDVNLENQVGPPQPTPGPHETGTGQDDSRHDPDAPPPNPSPGPEPTKHEPNGDSDSGDKPSTEELDGEKIPGDGTVVGDPQPGSDGDVPGHPPYPPPDEGSAPHGSRDPDVSDRAFEMLMAAAADAAEAMGYNHAAANLRHYLRGSGKPKDVNVGQMMRDVKNFRNRIENDLRALDPKLRKRALRAYRSNGGNPVTLQFQTPWRGAYITKNENPDYFYATGGFSYQISGYVTVEPPKKPGGEPRVVMHYRVSTYDRYNWDAGKAANLGPITIKDTQMQDLHETGLAREYDLRGSTPIMQREVGDGGPVTVDPPTGDREGNRSDPGRDRG